MTSEYQYDFTAYITLLPSNLGGRSKSVYSGFRPSLTFKNERQYSGELFFDTAKFLEPGKSAIVTIKLLPAVTIPKNLSMNDTFKILEGSRIIGTGIIKSEIVKKEIELLKA